MKTPSTRFPFDLLPERDDSAAANMATDFLLLRRYPEARRGHIRFRAYGWRRPAFSFGYAQKIAWVRDHLPPEAENGRAVELVRRPSGGGLVDHRNDWTYALVIPRGHPLEAERAHIAYRTVHTALAEALRSNGQPAALHELCAPPSEDEKCSKPTGPTICFTRPELYDVVHPTTGTKLAGAAQKRNREGLLFQGSVSRAAAANLKDWQTFNEAFVQTLANALHAHAIQAPWPDFPEGECEALTETYASTDWNEMR